MRHDIHQSYPVASMCDCVNYFCYMFKAIVSAQFLLALSFFFDVSGGKSFHAPTRAPLREGPRG